MAEVKSKPMPPMRGRRGMPVPKEAIKKGTFGRLLKTLMKYYKGRVIAVICCILCSSVGGLVSTVYMQRLVDDVITPAMDAGFTAQLQARLTGLIVMMAIVYLLVVVTSFLYTRIMATVTQGMLYHLRTDMFKKMQTLPIKYFDTHAHGDIMSTYTNDTDATRQLIGQSIPSLLSNVLTLVVSVVRKNPGKFGIFYI